MQGAYRCKIADLSEMERKWNAEIARAGADRDNWMVWKESAIRRAQAKESLPYYGILNGEIICEATAYLCAQNVQNAQGLVDETTAYLCAFRTVEAYRGKGYFAKLLRYLLGDLKKRGYRAATLGVEPDEVQNRQIYAHFGFDEYIKTAAETYPDGTIITVDYYRKKLTTMEQRTLPNNQTNGAQRVEIQWFPGHMTKTLRLMEREIHNVDVVLQLLDARIPHSSLNPEIARITKDKPHLYLLNKADLADPDVTAQWVEYFRRGGSGCLAVTSKGRAGMQNVKKAIEAELSELLQARADRGMAGAKRRVMVVGIPNVGKSTFINSFAGAARAKAADKPGVTRGKQWVTVGTFDLLDMPGVLWKKFDSAAVAGNLAFIGSIRDEILDIEAIAVALLGEMRQLYPERLAERYRLSTDDLAGDDDYLLLETIGRKRGMLMSGGAVNTERAATMLVDEFRGAKLGRISLERPGET